MVRVVPRQGGGRWEADDPLGGQQVWGLARTLYLCQILVLVLGNPGQLWLLGSAAQITDLEMVQI